VPYPFAHPAAVLPLARFGVPSALAIGSVVPDLWYIVPLVDRADSHGVAALFWFCVPAGLAVYALFHLVLKQPLIALLSPRLGVFTCAALPRARWHAVVASLAAGAVTHLAWDGVTHSNTHDAGVNWLQHANTLLGTALLAWWLWRKLRAAPPAPPRLSGFHRFCVMLALAGAMAIAALWSADIWPAFERSALRDLSRTAGIGALQGLGAAVLLYCALFQRKMP
jgi:hypothetical protein